MSKSEQMRAMAQKLRKTAEDLKTLREHKVQEKREKCAAVIVAKVGLKELQKQLSGGRR